MSPSGFIPIATGRDAHPQWSVDGQYILFGRIQDGRVQIWLMKADGSSQRKVVDELTPSPLTWDDRGEIRWNRAYDWLRGP